MATELQRLRKFMVNVVLSEVERGCDGVELRMIYDLFLGSRQRDPAWLLRGIRKAGVCPCKTMVYDPGPKHIKTCPFADPNYQADGSPF